MSATRDIEIDVSDEQIAEMTALGFWKPDENGILVLTDEGNTAVRDWIAARIAETKTA